MPNFAEKNCEKLENMAVFAEKCSGVSKKCPRASIEMRGHFFEDALLFQRIPSLCFKFQFVSVACHERTSHFRRCDMAYHFHVFEA